MTFQREAGEEVSPLTCWRKCQTVYYKNVHSPTKPSKAAVASCSVLSLHFVFLGSCSKQIDIKYNCSRFSSLWALYSLHLTSAWLLTQIITNATSKHSYYWLSGNHNLIFNLAYSSSISFGGPPSSLLRRTF